MKHFEVFFSEVCFIYTYRDIASNLSEIIQKLARVPPHVASAPHIYSPPAFHFTVSVSGDSEFILLGGGKKSHKRTS